MIEIKNKMNPHLQTNKKIFDINIHLKTLDKNKRGGGIVLNELRGCLYVCFYETFVHYEINRWMH